MLVLADHARAQSVPHAAQAAGVAAITAGIVLLGSDNNAVTSTTGTAAIMDRAAINATGGPNGPFGHPGTAGNGGGLPPGGAAGTGASGIGTSSSGVDITAVFGTVITVIRHVQ